MTVRSGKFRVKASYIFQSSKELKEKKLVACWSTCELTLNYNKCFLTSNN